MALYESETPFEARAVNLQDEKERKAYLKLSPFGKIPALEDTARNQTVFETSIIIEYLQQHYPGTATMIPYDPEAALQARLWDRLFDSYIHQPMQRIVANAMRPADAKDAHTVSEARVSIRTAYRLVENHLAHAPFAAGEAFTIADCAAAPALFYAQATEPFSDTHPNIGKYFDMLSQRPSFVRLIGEARPFLKYFPLADQLPERFRA